jgi:hypothetical protein
MSCSNTAKKNIATMMVTMSSAASAEKSGQDRIMSFTRESSNKNMDNSQQEGEGW